MMTRRIVLFTFSIIVHSLQQFLFSLFPIVCSTRHLYLKSAGDNQHSLFQNALIKNTFNKYT